VAAGSGGSLSDTSSVYGRSTSSRDTSSGPSSLTSVDGQNDGGANEETQALPLRTNHKGFACPFRPISDCNVLSTPEGFDQWYAHSISHFGNYPPPIHTICIFCDTTFQHNDPWRCWRERMHHIADHFEDGYPIEHARPDFALLDHLRDNSLITNEQYENAIKSQEGIFVEGLRPLGYIPEQTRFQKHFSVIENWIIHDIDKEERKWRRKGKGRPLPRRGRNVIPHITSPSKLEKPPERRVATAPTRRLDESNDVDSDTSSNDGLSDASSSVDSDREAILPRSLPPDVDQDEDLMDPKRHNQRLKDIQDKAFQNSTAFQLDYKSRVVVTDRRNHKPSVSDTYLECCDILRRIRQNIQMLKDSGFCQSQISFLKVDPRRINVALLAAIPVDSILQLGVAFELGQTLLDLTESKLAREKSLEIGSPNSIGQITRSRWDDNGNIDGKIDGEPKFVLLRVPDQVPGRSVLTIVFVILMLLQLQVSPRIRFLSPYMDRVRLKAGQHMDV
jgi:hypothetical protein